MSLGWQCESALLPSNSKPINVDGKSLVGLKALLYDEQQRARGKGGNDGHRTGRAEATSRKDYAMSNTKSKSGASVGDQKKASGNQQKSDGEPEPDVLAALTAKSKLYEEISRGKVQLQSDLVNFEEKVELTAVRSQTTANVNASTTYVPPPKPPSVPNPAKEYIANTQSIQPAPNNAQHSGGGSNVAAQPQWNWSTTYGSGSTTNAPPTFTNDREYVDDYKNQYKQELEMKKTIEDRIRAESEHNALRNSAERHDTHTENRVSEAARVKTQWEKTLNSSARGFLDQVHDDVATQRAASNSEAGQKRSVREEKMELIRQKRSKMTN